MPGPFISLYSLSRSQNIRLGSAQGGVGGLGALFTPTNVAVTTSTSGGSLANTTSYFYKVTATDRLAGGAVGETAPSAEVTVTTGTGSNSNTLTWNAVPGALGYNIYRSTTTGTEVFLTSVGGNVVTYTDTGAVTPGSASPPSSNTTSTAGRVVPQIIQNPSTAPLPYPLVVDLSDPVVRRDIGHHISEGNLIEVSGVRYTVAGPVGGNAVYTAASETTVVSLPIQPNLLIPGAQIRFTAQGVLAGTTPILNSRMRIGTTGSTSDASVVTLGTPVTLGGSGNGWEVNGVISCQAAGSGTNGKVVGNLQVTTHSVAPGISNSTTQVSLDTTLPQYATLTLTPGTSGVTLTVTNLIAEFMQQSSSFPC